MRKIYFLIMLSLVFVSCGMRAKTENSDGVQKEASMKDYVEVIYFHGKQRCATCMAIENNTKSAIETNFAKEIKTGKVKFRIIDISDDSNEMIAEKYEVTWSSLFVVRHKGDEETAENMTEFAFANARKSPDMFKDAVVNKVNEMLK